jgi:FlaA1/EpsC-like NDP-sugar epimerase
MLKRHWRGFFILVAIVTDALAIGAGGLIAYLLRQNLFHLPPVAPSRLFGVVLYSGTVLTAIALIGGLYRASFHTDVRRQHVLAAKAYFVGVPILVSSFYFLRWSDLPRVFTAIFLITIPFVWIAGRIALHRFARTMQRRGFGFSRTLLIDTGVRGPFFFHKLDILRELGYEIVAVVSRDSETANILSSLNVDTVVSPGDSEERYRKIMQFKNSRDSLTLLRPEERSLAKRLFDRETILTRASERIQNAVSAFDRRPHVVTSVRS